MELESPLLRLPVEIRLEIYEYLLVPSPSNDFAALGIAHSSQGLSSTVNRRHACSFVGARAAESERDQDINKDLPTLEIRALDPSNFLANYQRLHYQRTTFFTRADRFRGRTMETTYWVEGKGKPQTAILRVNRQIRREALPLLYSRHRFGFDTHVEALPPFIRDLTAEARNCIKSVAMTKRAAPFAKDYDCAEWANACKCIATMLPALEELKLCVIACKPSREGWHDIEPIEKEDMERMIQEYSFEWVTDLLQIKGLKKLDIQPQVQKCMSPGSNAMFHWIRFSKSIASSFTDVVRGMMVGD